MIPFKNADLKLSGHKPRHIVIHHTSELVESIPIDGDGLDVGKVRNLIYSLQRENKLGYHVIIERVKADYYPIVCQPWFTDCVWPDIDPMYYSDIHVAFIGNYDMDMLMDRAYKVLAFQILVPLSRYFRLDWEDIVLHKEISSNKELTCPGEFFDRVRLLEYFRTYYKRGPSITKI